MKACNVKIIGRVTGVGFRYSAVCEAGRYRSITGWVRNTDDRIVEAFVQGDDKDVAEMLAWLEKGPPGARVEEFTVDDTTPDPSLTEFFVDF